MICCYFIIVGYSRAPASKVRLVKVRKSGAPRRQYYDEKDRLALLQMRRLRVTWSKAEDSFLLICKVTNLLHHHHFVLHNLLL